MEKPRIEVDGRVILLKLGFPTANWEMYALRLLQVERELASGYMYRTLLPNGDLTVLEFEGASTIVEERPLRGHAGLMRTHLHARTEIAVANDWSNEIGRNSLLGRDMDVLLDYVRHSSDERIEKLMRTLGTHHSQYRDALLYRSSALSLEKRCAILSYVTSSWELKTFLERKLGKNGQSPEQPLHQDEIPFIIHVITRASSEALLSIRESASKIEPLNQAIEQRLSNAATTEVSASCALS